MSDVPYLIKSYHNKLEVFFPKGDENTTDSIEYHVWFPTRETGQLEKVKAKYPCESVTLENLNSNARYEVLVTKHVNCKAVSMTRQYASTTPFGPPDDFTARRESGGMVHLEWRQPGNIAPDYCIEGYIITVSNYLDSDVLQGKQFRYDGNANSASIQLDEDTSYVFQIEALSKDIVSEQSKTEIIMPKHKMCKEGIKIATTGNPNYMLTMIDTRDGDGQLCRRILGKPPDSEIAHHEKVFLVVGSMGSGKTTWINAMLNYILDVKYTDNFRLKLISDEDASTQNQHMTTYTIHHEDGFKIDYTLTVIDTPCFGDMRMKHAGKDIGIQLRQIFDPQNGCVDHVDAVCFVFSASSVQFTPEERYMFKSISSLFGPDIGDNTYMLFTSADGKTPQIMPAIKEANTQYQACLRFNHSAIFDVSGLEGESDFEMDDESEYFIRMFWDLGMKSFDRFFSKISHAHAKVLTSTSEVLNEWSRLELDVENLNIQVRLGLSKMDQLRIEEKLLKDFGDAIDTNEDYIYEFKRLEVKKIPISDNGLTCNFTGRSDCSIPNDCDKAKCSDMNQHKYPAACTQCPNHFEWNIHRNICYVLEQNVKTKTNTLSDLKARYEKASGKKLTANQIHKMVQEEITAIDAQIKANMSQISTSLNKLSQITLKNYPPHVPDWISQHLNWIWDEGSDRGLAGTIEKFTRSSPASNYLYGGLWSIRSLSRTGWGSCSGTTW